jgi:glycosyltransferase involved in cell wall biosynthesis
MTELCRWNYITGKFWNWMGFVMRLGIAIEETWDFFNEIYTDFQKRYVTSLFQRPQVAVPFFQERANYYLFNREMQRFLSDHDVVFFEWASDLLRAASHMPKANGIVTRLHRYELYKWVDYINWAAVDKVILVSEAKRREFITRFPMMAERTFVTSPSTSLEKFSFKPKPFSGDIGILCHLTPRKRVYDLILDFFELIQQHDGFHLHIGGGERNSYSDYFNAIHYIVDNLGLNNKVTFYGHVVDTPTWYHNIDIFVSHSYSEGLQVSPMEAMASGCYVLCHRWDGAEELLPEKQLYYSGNELRQKILTFSQLSKADCQREKEAMRTWACNHFDINQTIAEICRVIEDVAAQVMINR